MSLSNGSKESCICRLLPSFIVRLRHLKLCPYFRSKNVWSLVDTKIFSRFQNNLRRKCFLFSKFEDGNFEAKYHNPASSSIEFGALLWNSRTLLAEKVIFSEGSHRYGKDELGSNLQMVAQRRQSLNRKQRSYSPVSSVMNSYTDGGLIDCDPKWQTFFEQNRFSSSANSNSSDHHARNSANKSVPPYCNGLTRRKSSETFRNLDRKLERERERRTRTEPPPPRLENKGLFGEDFPPVDLGNQRNGFRSGGRNHYLHKGEQNMVTTTYRYGTPREFGAPLASVSGPNPSTAALHGHRIGFGSRDIHTKSSPNRGTRFRGSFQGTADRVKSPKFMFHDPVQGACPAFQQRLTEIAGLESETIRYEKTRKVKKKVK